MNIKVDFDNIVVKEDKNDFNVKVLMLKGEKGDAGEGENNVIEKVQVNGTDLPVTNKTVNVEVPTVDSTLSSSSTNPVQNKVIYGALSDKADASELNNYYEISEVDNLLNDKADTSILNNYYTKNETFNQSEINSMNSVLSSQILALSSGSPLVASSIAGMTDTTKIYVNTTDGYWYYYDGSVWQQGGIYQATIQNYDTTLTTNNAVPNSKSVGDKINNIVDTENFFDNQTFLNNYYINSSDVLINDNSYFLSNIIPLKQGDIIYCYIWKDTISGGVSTHATSRIAKVNTDGTIITGISNSSSQWQADEDCFIRVSVKKQSAYSDSDYINGFAIYKNYPSLSYKSIKYNLIENYEQLDEISTYKNYLIDFKLGSSMASNNTLSYAQNFFIANIMECKTGDVFYIKYFNNDNSIQFTNVNKLDINKHFIERSSVGAKSYTATHNGYVIFTCANPNRKTDIGSYCVISKNEELTAYVPPKRYLIGTVVNNSDVLIEKNNDTNYLISFGDFKITLFKTENVSTNAFNWNLKDITDKLGNIIVPTGTDIIGPIKLQGNSDFIGGVHGDETTNYVTVGINGNTYDLENVTYISGNSITITMKSTCYDEQTKNPAFDRFITIIITKNKIKISNSFKALANCTLISGPIGGLIACRNNIIKDIIFNNAYFNEPPTVQQDIASKYNTTATINTIYGSLTVNNIKGYTNDSYEGYLQTFANETPIRNKIYFMNYKLGTYSVSTGDILAGEFEYIFS